MDAEHAVAAMVEQIWKFFPGDEATSRSIARSLLMGLNLRALIEAGMAMRAAIHLPPNPEDCGCGTCLAAPVWDRALKEATE